MEPQINGSQSAIDPLKKVTPLSKYLAMVLFIILPFLGGYVGYNLAPERVVEKEVIKEVFVEKERDMVTSERENSYSVETRLYRNDDLGISFEYPMAWGEIGINNEAGNCPSGYSADDCNFQTLHLGDEYSSTIFLSAETKGHSDNPVGRGAFWGDTAGNVSQSYLTECKNDKRCNVVTNRNNVSFALYEADPPPEEMGYMPERYFVYNSNNQYYGIVLSPVRLNPGSSDSSKLFREIVVESFEFIQ